MRVSDLHKKFNRRFKQRYFLTLQDGNMLTTVRSKSDLPDMDIVHKLQTSDNFVKQLLKHPFQISSNIPAAFVAYVLFLRKIISSSDRPILFMYNHAALCTLITFFAFSSNFKDIMQLNSIPTGFIYLYQLAKLLSISVTKHYVTYNDSDSSESREMDLQMLENAVYLRSSQYENVSDASYIPTGKKFICKVQQPVNMVKTETRGSDECEESDRSTTEIINKFIAGLHQKFSPSDTDLIVVPVSQSASDILNRIQTGECVPPDESMQFEELRLLTMETFPIADEGFRKKLAKSGFYYAAIGDEVVCYCCGKLFSKWNLENDPLDVHRNSSPNCKFLVTNLTVNVPLVNFDADESENSNIEGERICSMRTRVENDGSVSDNAQLTGAQAQSSDRSTVRQEGNSYRASMHNGSSLEKNANLSCNTLDKQNHADVGTSDVVCGSLETSPRNVRRLEIPGSSEEPRESTADTHIVCETDSPSLMKDGSFFSALGVDLLMTDTSLDSHANIDSDFSPESSLSTKGACGSQHDVLNSSFTPLVSKTPQGHGVLTYPVQESWAGQEATGQLDKTVANVDGETLSNGREYITGFILAPFRESVKESVPYQSSDAHCSSNDITSGMESKCYIFFSIKKLQMI